MSSPLILTPIFIYDFTNKPDAYPLDSTLWGITTDANLSCHLTDGVCGYTVDTEYYGENYPKAAFSTNQYVRVLIKTLAYRSPNDATTVLPVLRGSTRGNDDGYTHVPGMFLNIEYDGGLDGGLAVANPAMCSLTLKDLYTAEFVLWTALPMPSLPFFYTVAVIGDTFYVLFNDNLVWVAKYVQANGKELQPTILLQGNLSSTDSSITYFEAGTPSFAPVVPVFNSSMALAPAGGPYTQVAGSGVLGNDATAVGRAQMGHNPESLQITEMQEQAPEGPSGRIE